jgi:hypothetical protein
MAALLSRARPAAARPDSGPSTSGATTRSPSWLTPPSFFSWLEPPPGIRAVAAPGNRAQVAARSRPGDGAHAATPIRRQDPIARSTPSHPSRLCSTGARSPFNTGPAASARRIGRPLALRRAASRIQIGAGWRVGTDRPDDPARMIPPQLADGRARSALVVDVASKSPSAWTC